MTDDSEWIGLPILEKVEHKIWRARLQGYNEMKKILPTLENKNELSLYAEALKKALTDINVNVQEKAMELLLSFITINPSFSEKIVSDAVNGIILKAFNSKPKIKQLGIDICLQFIENEKYESVIECLNAGLLNKQPKTISSCAETITHALKQFGPKIISYKIFIDNVIKLLIHNDKTVRDSAKLLIVELCVWVKAAIELYLTNIKPIILKEIQESAELVKDKPVISRYILSEKGKQSTKKPKMTEVNEKVTSDNEDTNDEPPIKKQEIDPYELMEAVDIIPKIDPNFYTAITEAKWSLRKEALDTLEKLTSLPKISNGSFIDLISALKKIVSTDANLNVILGAVKCFDGLAKGLRKNFSAHAASIFVIIFEKFKEKKPTVVSVLRSAVDSIYSTTDFNSIWEFVIPFFNHKNPSVKEELIRFIERIIIKHSSRVMDNNMIKNIAMEVLKMLDDGCGPVREAAYETIANLMNVAGQKNVQVYFEKLDDLKKQKLSELFSKLTPIVSFITKPPPKSSKKSTIKNTPASKNANTESTEPIKTTTRVRSSKKVSKKSTTKPVTVEIDYTKDQAEPSEPEIQETDAVSKGTALFGEEVITSLLNSVWKERLLAHSAFTTLIENIPPSSDFPSQIIFKLLDQKPGWKDSNFQILKSKYNIISILTKKQSPFSLRVAHLSINYMAEKLSDVKLKDQIFTTFSDICEVSSPNFVSIRLISIFKATKSVKVQQEILIFIIQLLEDYGLKIDWKFHVAFLKTALDIVNPDVKKSALTLLTTIYTYVGSSMLSQLDDLSPHSLSTVRAELDKFKDVKPKKPSKGIPSLEKEPEKISEPESESEKSLSDDNSSEVKIEESNKELLEQEKPKIEPCDDTICRQNISSELRSELLEELSDKNWKIRNEAASKISEIISKAKFILPEIGNLPQALALRLADSNKNILNSAINICKALAISIGPKISDFKQTIIPPLILTLCDSKPQIRAATIETLNEWVNQIGLSALLQGQESILYTGLKNQSAFCRTDLMTWFAERLQKDKQIDTSVLIHLLEPILISSSDRNPDARKASQLAYVALLPHLGIEILKKNLETFGSTQKSIISDALDAASEELKQKTSNETQPNENKHPVSSSSELPNHEQQEETLHDSQSESIKEEPQPPIQLEVKKTPCLITAKPGLKITRLFSSNYKAGILPKDFVSLFVNQYAESFAPSLYSEMFHLDFKHQCNAIQIFSNIMNVKNEEEIKLVFECSDLLYGWISCYLADCNPTLLSKTLDLLDNLFQIYSTMNYSLVKQELDLIVPVLISRFSDNKEVIKKHIHSLLLELSKISPLVVLISHLTSSIISSKIVKVRIESLASVLVIYQSINAPFISLPNSCQICSIVVKWIGERDPAIKNAASAYLAYAFSHIGEQIFEMVGTITVKEIELLQMRIRKLPPPILDSITFMDQNKTTDPSLLNSTFDLNESLKFNPDGSPLNQSNESRFNLSEYFKTMGISEAVATFKPLDLVKIETATYDEEFNTSLPSSSKSNSKISSVEKFLSQIDLLAANIGQNQDQLTSIIATLPLILKIQKIESTRLNTTCDSLILLLSFLRDNLNTISNSKSMYREILYIINYMLHYSPFVHSLSVDSFFKLLKLLLDLLAEEPPTASTDPGNGIPNKIIKIIISRLTKVIPLHVIIHSLALLSFDPLLINQSQIWFAVVKSCIISVTTRLNIFSLPVFMNSTQIIELFNKDSPIPLNNKSLSTNSEILYIEFSSFLSAFAIYINTKEKGLLVDLKQSYPIFYSRTKSLNIQFTQTRGVGTKSADEICLELSKKLESKLEKFAALKNLYKFGIEHNFDIFNDSSFYSIPKDYKLFLLLGFTVIRDNMIEAAVALEDNSSEKESCGSEITSYFARFKTFSEKITQILENLDSTKSVTNTGTKFDDEFNSLIKSFNEPSAIVLQNQTKVEQDVKTTKSTLDISNLRKRLDNLKKAYPIP